ncbi:MAG: polymer-forming cytoskeletal protein [Zoogloeaceae bacterium]|nr:polymer-forming cytoskeletal protein [Zoogloeaceae bacterium]
MFNKPANPFSRPQALGGREPTAGNRSTSLPTSPATQTTANSIGSHSTLRPSTSAATPPATRNDTEREKESAKMSETTRTETGSRLIVGPDVKLKGAEILDCDTLVVEGRVEATMDSRVIRIAEEGSFSGKVGIDIAEVHGHFEGELTARQQLIIHATGKVSGKIRYGKMLIEEGGEISGEIRALSDDDKGDERTRKDSIPTLMAATG